MYKIHGESNMRTLLLKITEKAQTNLFASEEAKRYLFKRGVTLDQIDKFQIGYFSKLPQVKDLSRDHKKWNSFSKKDHHEMITFPLYDLEHKICGFHIRTIKEKLYDKFFLTDVNFVFYGGIETLKCCYEKSVGIVVEGVFDFFSVSKYIPNSLALLTVNMSKKQKKTSHRYFKKIFLGLDSDGREKTVDTLDAIREELEQLGMTVYDKSMPYKDWNEYESQEPIGFIDYCKEITLLLKE